MTWLLLLCVLPLIVSALVVLCGFTGCAWILDIPDHIGFGNTVVQPTNLIAKIVGPNVQLTWTDNSNGDTFDVQRVPDSDSFTPPPAPVATGIVGAGVGGTVTWFDLVSALSPGKTYFYRVIAQGGDNPVPSEEASITIPIGGGPGPSPGPGPGPTPPHTYKSGANALETVPVGYTQLVIECYGPGGDGTTKTFTEPGGGGGGGAYAKKTIALTGADAGKTISYTVPTGTGSACTANTVNLANGSPNIITANSGANGSLGASGAGGTASNGDTNTSGSDGSIPNGGNGAGPAGGAGGGQAKDGTAPGGGGGGTIAGATPGKGAGGQITFTYNP